MIKTLENLNKAYKNYNPVSGIGAAELYKALAAYYKKYIEIDELLRKAKKICEVNKNGIYKNYK